MTAASAAVEAQPASKAVETAVGPVIISMRQTAVGWMYKIWLFVNRAADHAAASPEKPQRATFLVVWMHRRYS